MGKLVCVTTSHPVSTAITGAGGGGGSLITLCPQTGSIRSTLRVAGDNNSKQVGISSLSLFSPRCFHPLAMAFGSSTTNNNSNSTNKEDSYALLLSIKGHHHQVPASLHWRCRLPEANLSGMLIVSPCGHYCIGGGQSGNLYVWKTVGGLLLNTLQAHYRAVTVMEFCHGFLVTGGVDGMVHAFALAQLVADTSSSSSSSSSSAPMIFRTWSQHHVSVTALTPLGAGRLASASQDGHVQIVEICSSAVLANLSFDTGIRCMTCDKSGGGGGGRLFLGAQDGLVHIVDLNEYAIHQTMTQLGAKVINTTSHSKIDQFFSSGAMMHDEQQHTTNSSSATTPTFQYELRGHDRAVTALQMVDDNNLLVSGDEAGCLRVWDVQARICLRVIQPWSSGSSAVGGGASLSLHPVTSIRLLEGSENDRKEDFSSSSSSHNNNNHKDWLKLVTPLQKFVEANTSFQSEVAGTMIPVLLRPKRSAACIEFWTTGSLLDVRAALRKRQCQEEGKKNNEKEQQHLSREDEEAASSSSQQQQQPVTTSQQQQQPATTSNTTAATTTTGSNSTSRDENTTIQRLREELAQAKETIQRWEAVNNKLMASRLQPK